MSKVRNLTVDVFLDDYRGLETLQSVRLAEKEIVAEKHNHEYLPVDGLPAFNDAALSLIYGKKAAKSKMFRKLHAPV